MKAVDNFGNTYEVKKNEEGISILRDDIPMGLDYIEIVNEDFFASNGEDGYYVIADCDGKGSSLCKFTVRDDNERVYKQNLMPIFGVKKSTMCVLAIVEGFKYEFSIVFGVRKGKYYIYPRFYLNGEQPYEDISIRFINLSANDGYSEMARRYRKYRLESGEIKALADKIKENKYLAYAVEAPEIRIRMGWKPTPPKILEQTIENEPAMKVACTFERVKQLIDELKAQGVDKAQLCLVGWNKSGHDGRYPDVFPVEEKLGGETKLKDLISYAKKNGYQIVCHTNSTDCYSISSRFSKDIVVKNTDGSMSVNKMPWSGGRMYNLCPVKALEYAKSDLPQIKDLGFEGLHYIDVISVVPLRNCYDKKHRSNSKQTLEYYNQIMEMCHNLFGGFASEGVFDFTMRYLDYGLYAAWSILEDELSDCSIPLWEIVYHGITLYNPITDTVNYPIKEKKNELYFKECGGRPSFYFYSKHMEGGNQDNWLGRNDLICDTDEQLRYSVAKIKEAYEDYKKVSYLQTQFIEKHEEISENVICVTYTNGTQIFVDYNTLSVNIKNDSIA